MNLPGLCGICHAWDRGRLCGECVARFAPVRPRCTRCAILLPSGQPLCGACLREPPPYERAIAAVDYAAPWDGLIGRFKFHAGLDLTTALAALLLQAVRRDGGSLPDVLLPAPLSVQRLRDRGYNQSWEIGRRLAGSLGLRAEPQLLLRTRDTAHQIALPHDRRAANGRGAFDVEPLRRGELRGRDVAIVDDVLTTGATAAEMARTLLDAGAASVRAWVVARTPAPGTT
jgi:ComF family protein